MTEHRDIQVVPGGEIASLSAEFAWRIDLEGGAGVEDLFTADGVYQLGGQLLEGRGQIRAFYRARREQGHRTSRHLFSNLRVVPEGVRRVRCDSVLTLYAADGEPPYPAAPIAIADYRDTCVLEDDGQWRFRERRTAIIFGEVPHRITQWTAGQQG